jgi:hypothetical protein
VEYLPLFITQGAEKAMHGLHSEKAVKEAGVKR